MTKKQYIKKPYALKLYILFDIQREIVLEMMRAINCANEYDAEQGAPAQKAMKVYSARLQEALDAIKDVPPELQEQIVSIRKQIGEDEMSHE